MARPFGNQLLLSRGFHTRRIFRPHLTRVALYVPSRVSYRYSLRTVAHEGAQISKKLDGVIYGGSLPHCAHYVLIGFPRKLDLENDDPRRTIFKKTDGDFVRYRDSPGVLCVFFLVVVLLSCCTDSLPMSERGPRTSACSSNTTRHTEHTSGL